MICNNNEMQKLSRNQPGRNAWGWMCSVIRWRCGIITGGGRLCESSERKSRTCTKIERNIKRRSDAHECNKTGVPGIDPNNTQTHADTHIHTHTRARLSLRKSYADNPPTNLRNERLINVLTRIYRIRSFR